MIPNLKTPQEFIDYYWTQLQDELALKNIQVSKVGFIGFFLHVLGFTQFDAKNYYDDLFKEAFPILAEERQNLYFHSALYGYIPPLAIPAHLVGTFEFLLESLPIKDDTVVKRDIYLNNITLDLDNNLHFELLSKYHLVNEEDFFVADITNKNNKSIGLNFTYSKRTVPIIDMEQVEIIETEFTTPTYAYGSFYAKLVDIPYHFINDIKVYIEGNEYKVEYVKNFTGSEDEVVFVRYLAHNIVIEFGSGIHGKYVPRKDVKVVLQVTKGVEGNIAAGTYYPSTGTVTVIDTLNDGTVKEPYTFTAEAFVRINVTYGEGGQDIISSDNLRNALIKYIRHRMNLVSERDFYDIFQQYVFDFELLFKKMYVVDNNIYMHVPFRDQYMVPMYTGNVTVPVSLMDTSTYVSLNNKQYEYNLYPEFQMYDTTTVSPFLYLKDDLMNTWKGYLFYDQFDQYFDNFESYNNQVAIIPASLQFKFVSPNIRFIFHSFQRIANLTFRFSCSQLNISDEIMHVQDENNVYIDLPFFIDVIDVSIDVYDELGSKILRYEANGITPIVDYTDYNTLKRYTPPDSTTWYWINIDSTNPACIQCICDTTTVDTTTCHIPEHTVLEIDPAYSTDYYIQIPVIDKTQFNKNKLYILNNLGDIFTNILDPGNRMISDEVLIKFLQTYFVPANILQLMTIQEYNFDIHLPLQLHCDIYVDTEYAIANEIDIASEFENLKISVADTLLKAYTGTTISFYRTQMVDYIHNWNWVKHVEVWITDNNGLYIPESNIETIPNRDVLDKIKDKFEAVKFEPVYWYWDINNIELNLRYSENE